MRRDPLIIGGGPAGAAAAITLGRAGFEPVLLERTTGPTDKVCGDFLSADTIQHAQSFCVDPHALGAAPVDRIRLIHRERAVEAALPFAAVGLSRRALDAALLHQAERFGAIVRTGQTVRHLTSDLTIRDQQGDEYRGHPVHDRQGDECRDHAWRNGKYWTADTGGGTGVTAQTVFLATGKHDLREMPRARGDHGAVGMKMYYALAPGPTKSLEGAIELTLFPGGYAGMQHVENGRTVLCIAVQRRAFQRYGGGWPALIAAIEQRSRHFAAMLTGARALLPRPLAVAGVPYGYQAGRISPDGLFRLGDQAAVIPSLTGDGMAIALHSGKTAANIWLAGGDATAYHHALTHTLGPQMRLAGLLHRICMAAPVQSAMFHTTVLFPSLLRYAACHTRLPPSSSVGA